MSQQDEKMIQILYENAIKNVLDKDKPVFPKPPEAVIKNIPVDDTYLNDLMRYTYEQ